MEEQEKEENISRPVVVDLGKRKKKYIKLLKKGRGRLMDEVNMAIEAAGKGTDFDKNKEIVPLIFLYRKKEKKRNRGWF
ncbi:MAG: hypothetical protein GKR87_06025 [Kiritimatiellae bacterium]|nr:hypothetical protein [Kiritimatiellia bacterium]